ncbi:MAG: cell division protein SepF [Microbacteriaceae bacterium]|jgi:cell division inhibitor SepF
MANPLRNAMVYLGLADEDSEFEAAAPVRQTQLPERDHTVRAGAVTPLRRAPAPRQGASEMNEILTVHPRQYKDAQVIAENFREGIPVIINLSQMSEPDARRLIDFASGLSMGLYGRIERVTSKVFLLSPAHVAISGDQSHSDDVDASFFSQTP